jgi:galactofuranose transport system ATP-binding protein
MSPILQFKSISKQLGGTLAVDEVDVDIAAGQIHALLGRMGRARARSSKCCRGCTRRTVIAPRNPNEAIVQGIAFVSSNREVESLMSLLVRENFY